MKTIARRQGHSFTHELEIGSHRLTADEPIDQGGEDHGPSPQELLGASLASCMAITIEMYARRKEWDIGPVEVEVEYEQAERGLATHFDVVIRLADHLEEHQIERLRVIAGKCPVHRTLAGPAHFTERLELIPGG